MAVSGRKPSQLDETTRFRAAEAPRTVLVVDDEAEVRELMAGYLRARGLEVVEAANGLEALLKFRLVRPRAVVLDILMPRLGGLQALQRIRALDQNVAVVAVTGSLDTELRAQILASGATAILSKPVRLQDLWAAPGVKVIMISGAASFELATETLAHGAFDFIPKPPDLKALSQTLQAAFLMKRLEAEWHVEPAADD